MIRTVEWLNQNRYRNYPFVENAVVAVSDVQLPLDLLLDMQLLEYTHAHGTGSIYLRTIVVATVSVTFNFSVGVGGALDYSITVPKTAALPYEARLNYTSGSTKYELYLVIGEGFNTLLTWTNGTYVVDDGRIEAALCHFQTKHRVTEFLGDTDDSVPVAGDVYFEEGAGVAVSISAEARTVRLNGFPGAGAGYPCDAVAEQPNIVLTLVSDVIQPSGSVTVDSQEFTFGDPSSGGSGSSGEVDEAIYVPYEGTASLTFQALAAAITVAIPSATVVWSDEDELGSGGGTATITITRDNALVENSNMAGAGFALTRNVSARLGCVEAIVYINDVTADGYGNFQLAGGKGIEIETDKDNHTIYIRNKLDVENIACGTCEKGMPNA